MVLHGLPYALAPGEQTHVPMPMPIPAADADQRHRRRHEGVPAAAAARRATLLDDTVPGRIGVDSGVLNQALDLSSECRSG